MAAWCNIITHPDSSDKLHKSLILCSTTIGYYKLQYRWGYYEGTLTLLWPKVLCIQKLQSTLHSTHNSTPTCSSHSDSALYETHIAGQEESGCVHFYAGLALTPSAYHSRTWCLDGACLSVQNGALKVYHLNLRLVLIIHAWEAPWLSW